MSNKRGIGFEIEEEGLPIDMVCGMELGEKTEFSSAYKGRKYYFCSENCREHFENNPKQYVD